MFKHLIKIPCLPSFFVVEELIIRSSNYFIFFYIYEQSSCSASKTIPSIRIPSIMREVKRTYIIMQSFHIDKILSFNHPIFDKSSMRIRSILITYIPLRIYDLHRSHNIILNIILYYSKSSIFIEKDRYSTL